MAITQIRQRQIKEINRIWETITQSSHGFSAGQVVYFNGLTWALAKADDIDTAEALGIIEEVTTNTFKIIYQGHITGLSGLVAGETYFISASSAGSITTTEPTGDDISKPILVALSSTGGIVNNWRGLTGGGTGGGDATVLKSNITQSSHGFSAGDVLRHNGTTYVKAQADTEDNSAAIGIIESVVDTNNYVLAYGGLISITGAGFTAGEVYYLSAATAGAITTTAPTIKKQVLIAISSTAAILLIDSVGGAGTGDVSGPSSSVDEAIVRFDGTGGKTIQDYTSNAPTISDTGIVTINNDVTFKSTGGATQITIDEATGDLSSVGEGSFNSLDINSNLSVDASGNLSTSGSLDGVDLDINSSFTVDSSGNVTAMGYVTDNIFVIAGNGDTSKQVDFDVDTNVPTSTTNTYIFPATGGTLALTSDIQTVDLGVYMYGL